MQDYKIAKYLSKINSTNNESKNKLYNLKISYYRKMLKTNNMISSMYGGSLLELKQSLEDNLGKYINHEEAFSALLNRQMMINNYITLALDAVLESKKLVFDVSSKLMHIKDAALLKHRELAPQSGGVSTDEIIANVRKLDEKLQATFKIIKETSTRVNSEAEEIIRIISEMARCIKDLEEANRNIDDLKKQLKACKADNKQPEPIKDCSEIQDKLDDALARKKALEIELENIKAEKKRCDDELAKHTDRLQEFLEELARLLATLSQTAEKNHVTATSVNSFHDRLVDALHEFNTNTKNPDRFSKAIDSITELLYPKKDDRAAVVTGPPIKQQPKIPDSLDSDPAGSIGADLIKQGTQEPSLTMAGRAPPLGQSGTIAAAR